MLRELFLNMRSAIVPEEELGQTGFVEGDGNERAQLMLIGEAPGAQEVEMGRPFVGKAGKNLDEFLEISGIEREQLYVTNVVKFRPYKTGGNGRLSNRTPNAGEIEQGVPWLLKEIELVNPKILVTLGNTPLRALLGKGHTVGQLHAREILWRGRLLYPLYHPAAVIYNPQLKQIYIDDIKKLGQIWVGK